MLPTLLVATLLGAPDAGPLPHTLFIFSGGATEAAAKAELAAFEQLRGSFEKLLAPLSKGYPKVVESAKIDGLKPGFFIVVLAACDSALTPNSDKREAPFHTVPQLLELYKAIDARVYARSVTWPEPLACPEALYRWAPPRSAEVKVPGGSLRGSLIDIDEESPSVLALFLRDDKGAVLDSKVEQDTCSPGEIEKNGRGLEVSQTCVTGRCTSWGHSQFDVTWTVLKGKILSKVKERVIDKASCD
jgi:hypothetical protein